MAPRRNLNEEIAENIRNLAGTRNRTLADVARVSGLAERTFKRRMTGLSAWTTDELEAVASALAVKPSTLVRTRT